MSKNKKIVLLVGLVCAIWGFIAYKIISGMEGSLPDVEVQRSVMAEDDVDSTESYSFNFSYEDPFLKRLSPPKSVARPKISVVRNVARVVTAPVNRNINWDRLRYKGAMFNATRKTAIASVTLDDKDYFVRQGESLEEFVVVAIVSDSIKISCEGNVRFLKREK